MDPMPLAGQFCSDAREALEAHCLPLSWVLCHQCGLVQVVEDVDESILFRRYNYASSTVSGLVKHFENYAAHLETAYGTSPVRFLEIGCNDGVLLRRLPESWVRQGVDPSDVARKSHEEDGQGYELANEPFTAEKVASMGWIGQWDVISGSNCLAHISDLKRVFEAAYMALRDGGELWVEVHDLEALLCGNQWDTIYHEHKAEWSEDSLVHCLGMIGFERLDTQTLSMHGGALRCRFIKRSEPAVLGCPDLKDLKKKLHRLEASYRKRYDHAVIRELMGHVSRGQQLVAYGAAGRANVFLNQMAQLPFAWIIDESPLRHGRFLPHVATPIVPMPWLAEHQPPHCLITAWNYASDIRGKHPDYQGRWWTAFS